jgi:hypothetical protein
VLGEDDPRDALERFDLVSAYPTRAKSRSLTYGALLVGVRNPKFLVVPAVLNLLLFAANSAGLRPDEGSIADVATNWTYGDLLTGQFRGSLSIVLVLVLFVLLTAFHKVPKSTPPLLGWVQRIIAGGAHTVAQVLAHGLAAWLAIEITDSIGVEGVWFTLVVSVLVLVFGAVLGSLVFGAYLVVCLAVFRRHANEAFSAARYETYKNFLRLHIGAHGVTVYPIGIDKPCKNWKLVAEAESPEDSYLAPAAGTIHTKLIEPPFTV